ELLVQLSGTDFLAGLDDDLRLLLVEQSELTVGERGRLLDAGQRHDQVGIDRNWGAGNWEVLDSSQRVDTVVGFCGNFAIAEQIVLDAMLGSCHIAAPVMRRRVGRPWPALLGIRAEVGRGSDRGNAADHRHLIPSAAPLPRKSMRVAGS